MKMTQSSEKRSYRTWHEDNAGNDRTYEQGSLQINADDGEEM